MRYTVLFPILLLLAGCGASAASSPAPTRVAHPTPALPPGARFRQAPAMTINTHHQYTAVVKTSDGTLTIQLLPKMAPVAVNNFVFLARHHYYDHNQFFRIMRTFMVQTGDPTNTGFGGPGYTFKDEKVTLPYTPGIVAYANHGPNTNGSQFFIVTGPDAKSLPKAYLIFGRVASGMSVLRKIALTPVTMNANDELSQPLSAPWIKTVTILERP